MSLFIEETGDSYLLPACYNFRFQILCQGVVDAKGI